MTYSPISEIVQLPTSRHPDYSWSCPGSSQRVLLILPTGPGQLATKYSEYAVATERAEINPTADLRGALPPARPSHLAAITGPEKAGGFLRAMDGYKGPFSALRRWFAYDLKSCGKPNRPKSTLMRRNETSPAKRWKPDSYILFR